MSEPTLTLIRTFKAPREQVFNAFTKREALQSWFGPEGYTVPRASIDVRTGGRYRIEMHSPEGTVHILTGDYREVRPPERLVFTWAWLDGAGVGPQTLVTLTFAAKGENTELTMEHSGFATAEARDAHNRGWSSSLDCLAGMLAGKQKQVVARPTILGDPRSTHVRSVRMAFVEKGIAYELEPHAPHSEPVNAIHPFGKIPAFRAGGLQLFETSAILRYVDEAFPGPKLMPESPADRARAEQWISCVHCYFFDAMIRRYVLQYVFPKGADGKPDRTVIDAALAESKQQLGVLDAAYGGRTYLAADQASLADLFLAPIVFYVQNMPEGKELLAPFGNVRRAHAAMAERESFQVTMPPMGN
ncbi:MAG TPA: SRPBCC domain-containing protein [Burkholderiales bacterium]|nr:SRPBCC domain-containing protein [Burkholderiales bacterium]